MNGIQTTIIIILAALLMFAYYYFCQTDEKYDSYLTHPFWFGIDKNVVILLVFCQVLAIIGFLAAIGSWLINPPKTGCLKDDKLFYALLFFFLSNFIWPIATKYNKYLISILGIILTAAASIWLLAGAVEEENDDFKVYRVAGLLCLCIVTVLSDGVIWSSNYIIKNKEKI